MAEDFSKLSSAIDTVTTEIAAVVAVLQNPATDNNNQSTIDGLTSRLTDAAAALGAALPPAAAPGSGPANDNPNTSPPADGSGSGDVTP